jgi:hypothetical protein
MNLNQRIHKLAGVWSDARLASGTDEWPKYRSALEYQKTQLMKECSATGKAELTEMYMVCAGLAQIISDGKLEEHVKEIADGLEKTLANYLARMS